MDDVAAKIIEILKSNMSSAPATLALETPLSELGLESLDIAVIAFDIEDAFGIELPYTANDGIEDFSTVGSVVKAVKAVLDAPAAAA